MKKTLAFLLAVIMAFSFVSCGKEKAEMYCYSCGKGVSKNDAFCSACGASMDGISEEKEESSQSETQTQTTQPETTTEPTTPATTVHTHSYNKKVTAPTCTKKGYTTYTCSCGDSYKDNYKNAAHSYKKYVCTSCGAIDKKHAYEYLIEWIKENGEYRKDEVFFSLVSGDGAHEVVYNEKYDFMYVRIKSSDHELVLDLSDPDKNFTYSYEYDYYSVTGKVNAKTFTKDTIVSCDDYSGYSGDKDKILKMVSLTIQMAVVILDMLDIYEAGVTYQDLGFESYVM